MHLSPSQFEATSNLECSPSPSVTIGRWNPFRDIISGLGQTAPIYYFCLAWFTAGIFGLSYLRAGQEMEDDAARWGGVSGGGWKTLADGSTRLPMGPDCSCCFMISGYLIHFFFFFLIFDDLLSLSLPTVAALAPSLFTSFGSLPEICDVFYFPLGWSESGWVQVRSCSM